MVHISWHVCKYASISQRLVTFIQTPGKRQSVRVWPHSERAWNQARHPFIVFLPTLPRSDQVQQPLCTTPLHLWVQENSDFLGLETPDSSRWCRFIKIKEQKLKVKNKIVLASRPGAISTFPHQLLWHLQTSAGSDLLFARSRLRGLAFWLDRNGGKTEQESSNSREIETLQAHVKQCHR